MSVLIEHFAAATAALTAGQREAGVMTEHRANGNRPPAKRRRFTPPTSDASSWPRRPCRSRAPQAGWRTQL